MHVLACPNHPGSVAATAHSPPAAAAARRYDKRDGRGKMTFVRGLQYDGEWKDDKAHGWVPAVPHVCDEWEGASTALCVINCLLGCRCRCCGGWLLQACQVLQFADPSVCDPEFAHMCLHRWSPCTSLPCSQGAARYENGGVYVGEFANDVRSGWGEKERKNMPFCLDCGGECLD